MIKLGCVPNLFLIFYFVKKIQLSFQFYFTRKAESPSPICNKKTQKEHTHKCELTLSAQQGRHRRAHSLFAARRLTRHIGADRPTAAMLGKRGAPVGNAHGLTAIRRGLHCQRLAFVRIKVTLLINHYNKNKLANYFQNFNSACRFLMITYYCFYVLCIWHVF